MTVLCERKKMTREELLSMRPYILAWRKKENQKELELLRKIHNTEKVKEIKAKEVNIDFKKGREQMKKDEKELADVIDRLNECQERLNHLHKEKHKIFTEMKSVLNKKNQPI